MVTEKTVLCIKLLYSIELWKSAVEAPLNTHDIAAVWPHTQWTTTFPPFFTLCRICVVKHAAAL